MKVSTGKTVVFFADNMADDEGGMFTLDEEEQAEALAGVLEIMIDAC